MLNLNTFQSLPTLQSKRVSDADFQLSVNVLLAIVVVLVLACTVVVACYLVLARRISFRLHSTLVRMETLLEEANQLQSQQHDGVPPLRISLRPVENFAPLDADGSVVQQLEDRLQRLSFYHIGDFCIAEDYEQLRLFLSHDRDMIAAIRKPVQSRLYAEFFMDLGQGSIAGVGNPAIGSVVPVDTTCGKHFSESFDDNVPLLSRMWLEAKEMADQLDCLPINPDRISEIFESAHAKEMDWRMAHGGVTQEEVTAAFLAQGIAATRHDVEAVQERWQSAIDAFILKHANATGPRDQFLVVHNHTLPSHVRRRFAANSPVNSDANTTESCALLLENLLALFPAREAVARLRPQLSDAARFHFVKQTTRPFDADIYRFTPNDGRLQNG